MKQLQTVLLALAVFSTAAAPSFAINRYNTQKMTCDQVQSALNTDRAAILRYPSSRNPSITLYDRYVRSGYYCDGHTVPERVSVPTKDARNCPVIHCIPRPDRCDTHPGSIECEDPLRMK